MFNPYFFGIKNRVNIGSSITIKIKIGNASDESGLEMIFKDWLESDQRLEGNVIQVAVTSLSELEDLQSVKLEEGEVIDLGRRKESAAVCFMTQQHRRKLTQQHY